MAEVKTVEEPARLRKRVKQLFVPTLILTIVAESLRDYEI